jgi:hypothetical protein
MIDKELAPTDTVCAPILVLLFLLRKIVDIYFRVSAVRYVLLQCPTYRVSIDLQACVQCAKNAGFNITVCGQCVARTSEVQCITFMHI